jgi:hypothetical protein
MYLLNCSFFIRIRARVTAVSSAAQIPQIRRHLLFTMSTHFTARTIPLLLQLCHRNIASFLQKYY